MLVKNLSEKLVVLLLVVMLSFGSISFPVFAEEGIPLVPGAEETPTQTFIPTEPPTEEPVLTPTPVSATEAPSETEEPTPTPIADEGEGEPELPIESEEPALTEEPSPGLSAAPEAFDLAALLIDPAALREAALLSSAFQVDVELPGLVAGVPSDGIFAQPKLLPEDVDADSLSWVLLPPQAGLGLTLLGADGNRIATGKQAALAFDGSSEPGNYTAELVCATPDGRMALAALALVVEPAALPEPTAASLLDASLPGAELTDAFDLGRPYELEKPVNTFYYSEKDKDTWKPYYFKAEYCASTAEFSIDEITTTGAVVFELGGTAIENNGGGYSWYQALFYVKVPKTGTSTFRLTCTQGVQTVTQDFTVVVSNAPSDFPTSIKFKTPFIKTALNESGTVTVSIPQIVDSKGKAIPSKYNGTLSAYVDGSDALGFPEGALRITTAVITKPGRYLVHGNLFTANLSLRCTYEIIVTDSAAPSSSGGVMWGDKRISFGGYFSQPFSIYGLFHGGTAGVPVLGSDEDYRWEIENDPDTVAEASIGDTDGMEYFEVDVPAPTEPGDIKFTVHLYVFKMADPATPIDDIKKEFSVTVPDSSIPIRTLTVCTNDTQRTSTAADLEAYATDTYRSANWESGEGCYFDYDKKLWIATAKGAYDMFLLNSSGQTAGIVTIIAEAAPSSLKVTPASVTLGAGDTLALGVTAPASARPVFTTTIRL